MRARFFILAAGLLFGAANLYSQTLNLPSRPTNALTGSQFANVVLNMSQNDRENWVLDQVTIGNVPNWLRTLVPITINQTISGTPHSLKYYVTPDYLAIGSDADYFLEPTTPILAQRIANMLNCTLPTRLMVNQIWTNSPVKMTANTVNPTNNNNATVPVFILQDNAVDAQRTGTFGGFALGTLVSGDKKDEIISTYIYNNLSTNAPKPVVIYGWIQPNGSPIQPLFNGHAESYMDYSHGVRLVQMAAVLDGVTNAMTNIMADATLWPLVGDEGGPISKPYYTIDNTIAPVIITQPYSQTVSPGSTVTLSVNVTGDMPITYAWKSNGVPLSNMTNASMTIANVQPANAATYTVTLNNSYGSATSIPAVLKVNTTAFPLLYSDNFDTNSSANWNLFFGSADGVIDYTADWAYNYGATPYTFNGQTFVIPPAPNSIRGPTKGVRFTVNNNDTDGAIAGLNIYPKNQTFSGNFALKFDMWLNYPGNAGGTGTGVTGTTEFAIFGINHLGTEVNWGATNGATMTDGIWFGVDGEGGTVGTDYRAYLGNPSGLQTVLAAGAASGIPNEDNTYAPWETLFPTNRFETIGVPGKEWVACEINQSNGVITWKLDGTIIAQRANTSSYTSGDVMLGYMDVFASIANPTNDAYVLFDNMRVEDWSSPPLQTATIGAPPTNAVVYTGGTATFSVTPGGSSPFTYQWSFNGTNLPGATNSSYLVTNAQSTNAGIYSVVVSNAVGSITSTGAQLTVIPPIQYGQLTVANSGQFQFSFNGMVGIQYVIQTSTDLTNWVTLTNVTDTVNPVTFTDSNSPVSEGRFYRVLP